LNAGADNRTKQKGRTATIVPECVVGRLARQGVTNAAKVHRQRNQPFFNIIAPGRSAAAINNSPIQQFTH
jgi:hypothetical protein